MDNGHSEKEKKTKLLAAGVALLASAGVLVGGLFSSPAALLDDAPTPIVAYADDDDLDEDDAENETGASGEEETESVGLRARMRQRILQLPLIVRLLVILPLWALGWGILTLASALWGAVLSPVLGKALAWLLLLAALLGAFALAGKTLFPDLPLKKILNKRSILGLVIGAALLGVADYVVPLFWAGYSRVEAIARAAGILLVFGTATVSFAVREQRRRNAAPEHAPEPELQPLSRRQVLELADSVSGK